jgi:hypothetical protein
MRKATILLLVLIVQSAPVLAQSQQVLDLDEIMSEQDQQAAGLSKLSEAERAALERWITDWSLKIYEMGAQGTADNSSSAPTGSTGNIYSGVGGGHWISKVIDNGAYIRLEDGSLWEVASVDRVYTSIWLPVTEITVIKAENAVGDYSYLLINTDDGEKAYARLVSQ